MKLPIDTSAIKFVCATPPEPMLDFETKEPRVDENGAPLYSTQVMAMGEREANLFGVKVSGRPADGVCPGAPVKVIALVAQPWTMGDRSGISFRAEKIEPVTGSGKS